MWNIDLLPTLVGLYLIITNLVGFTVMGVDKHRAKRGQWRVREKTMFTIAALFGAAGVWAGMRYFHHKTLHNSFRFGIPAILAAQITLAIVLTMRFYFN